MSKDCLRKWLRVSSLPLLLGVSVLAQDRLLETVSFPGSPTGERWEIRAPRAETPPTLDGVLDEALWQTAWRTNRLALDTGAPARQATELRLAVDDGALYLALQCRVAEPAQLRLRSTAGSYARGAWGDDCVEVKVSADGGLTERQFIVTAGGAFSDSLGAEEGGAGWRRAARVTADGYTLEIALPAAALGLPDLAPGRALLLNAGRVDRAQREELSSLTPPYLDLDAAPVLSWGEPGGGAAAVLPESLTLSLALDRARYPAFERRATGRLQLWGLPRGDAAGTLPPVTLELKEAGVVLRSERIDPLRGPRLDFDLPLSGLAPGMYELTARLDDGLAQARRELEIHPGDPPATAGRVALTALPAEGEALPGKWPVTFGVPFPWGALESEAHVRLLDAAGREIPTQVRVAARWSKGGSIRWLHIDALLDGQRAATGLALEYGAEVRRSAAPDAVLLVEETQDAVTVTTGPLRFEIPRQRTPGIAALWLDRDGDGAFTASEAVFRPSGEAGPYLVDGAGRLFLGSNDAEAGVALEDSGPLKACVRVSGWHVDEAGARQGRFILRFTAYAGQPWVKVSHTLIVTSGSNPAVAGLAGDAQGVEPCLYRDIGYALPLAVNTAVFGTPRIHVETLAGAEDRAWLWQRDDRTGALYRNGVLVDEFGRAEGWMTAGTPGGRVSVSVRDFWQNFPKELEARRDGVRVHFWPAHGGEPLHGGTNLALRTVHQNWFVHEGRELDFAIPEEVMDLVLADTGKGSEESIGAPAANALGLAKTHELLLHVHAPSWEDAHARAVGRQFQANPTVACAPEWVCGTKVFGHMLPRSPERFPVVEEAVDRTVAQIFRQSEADRDYGMFNFGDAHHNWNWLERRWNLHRIWRNTHHGWARWPWLLYARSGSKALFDWADRNARHVADIDHCHHAPEAYRKLPWPQGKLPGGICDYKGFVHWASGSRLGYNSSADALLNHHYFTGDPRSLETALEHGRALLENGRAQPHREGSGRLTSAIALYLHTWDNAYLDFIERTLERLLSTQAEDGAFPQWEDFAPFLQRYVELTDSPLAREAMVRWARCRAAWRTPRRLYTAAVGVLAHGTLYSGDPGPLRRAAHFVADAVQNLYFGGDPLYEGMIIPAANNLDQSYFLQWIPYYLYAADRNGGEPEPAAPDRTWLRTYAQGAAAAPVLEAWQALGAPVPEKGLYQWTAKLRQGGEGAFTLRIELAGGAGQRFLAQVEAAGRAGAVFADLAFPANAATGVLTLPVPEDRAADYTLRIYSGGNFRVLAPTSDGVEGMREVYPVFDGGMALGDGLRWHFDLPEGAERVMLGYRGRAAPARVVLFGPGGERVAEDTWIGGNALDSGGLRHLSGAVGGRDRRGWSFAFWGTASPALHEMTFSPEGGAGRTPHFALGPERLFEPAPEP